MRDIIASNQKTGTGKTEEIDRDDKKAVYYLIAREVPLLRIESEGGRLHFIFPKDLALTKEEELVLNPDIMVPFRLVMSADDTWKTAVISSRQKKSD